MRYDKKLYLTILLAGLTIILSACGTKTDNLVAATPLAVKGQAVAQSSSVKENLSYSALVAADSEATIAAKANGNLTGLQVKVGDKVSLGQELAKVDDVNSPSFNAANFNTNQIKQAKIVVSQAEASYNLARTTYDSLLISSVKDLHSAEIARDQASKGQSNLDVTTGENYKSAQLAYETAKIAAAQASTTLWNKERQATQSVQDTKTNADLAASAVVGSSGSLITGVNNIGAFDDNNNVVIGYKTNLGALDPKYYDQAKQSYLQAKAAYNDYLIKNFSTVEDKVDAAVIVTNAAKKMVDDTRILLDKTTPSATLPQSSTTGVSLSGLQSALATYQAQINAALSQVNSMKQALVNVNLNNDSLLDSLRQALQIAQQQEASARQNLNTLSSNNTSQQNNASFSTNLAENQFENTKVKIEAQVNAARTQMENAQLQYNTAVVNLQSLYDAHSIVSPINGTVTKVFVAAGQSVAAGQAVITVSQTDNIKVQFYLEADNLADIKPGLAADVVDSNGTIYHGAVSAISPQADALTKRFLAEVKLENSSGLLVGTVVNVNINVVKTSRPGLLLLPLSAVTVGQNGSYIFINSNNQAKKVAVEISEVVGELAQVKVDLPADAVIITEGNRLLQDGQAIVITQ
jgi:RND family efflux transporter MFP subunit